MQQCVQYGGESQERFWVKAVIWGHNRPVPCPEIEKQFVDNSE